MPVPEDDSSPSANPQRLYGRWYYDTYTVPYEENDHWRNFFVHEEKTFSASGPYKLFANPMYTLGYAHAYGVALAWLSFPGLLAAAFAQATILALNALIEQPHFRRHKEG